MNSVGNLSQLGSDMVHTLRTGSTAERLVLGSVLAVTVIIIAERIYKLAATLFARSPEGVSLNPPPNNQERRQEYERILLRQLASDRPLAQPPQPASPPPALEPQAYSLLASLSIREQSLVVEQEPLLAKALHAYQELKTEIGGDEGRFVFLAETYYSCSALPEKLKWEAREVELDIPSHFNQAFKALDNKLGRVGLRLQDIKTSDQPLGKAHFKDGTTKGVLNLDDLYRTVKLQGPHILSPLEIHLKKERIVKAKATLHESRLEIIDKTLATLRTVLIDELLRSFPEKHKDLYSLFGNNPEALRFAVENICWHTLDLALEWMETTFVQTEEKQQKHQQLELENLLKKGLPDEGKRKQAELFLIEILKNPNNKQAIESLLHLLINEKEINSDREALIRKVQDPKLQLEEERIQQELGRLEGVQKFFTTILFAVGVVDQGKIALQIKKEEGENKKSIVVRPVLPPPQPVPNSLPGQETYAQQIEKVSTAVVKAGERAIKNIGSQRWQSAWDSIQNQLKQLPNQAILGQIIQEGWTRFADKKRFLGMNRHQRWLITQAMIYQKLTPASLEKQGSELVQEVGKWASSFVKTLYGRLVTAFLAFEQRTYQAGPSDAKPADRIAEAFIDPLLKSFHALQKVKKSKLSGERENGIVKELENTKEMHPSASNKRSADAVFLGKLILELLSILQPEGLSGDIHKVLVKAWSQPGQQDPTLLQKTIEKYKTSVLHTTEPWIQPVWNFLIQALQNIIERQSAHNIADQMSDWLHPANINGYLVDFLLQDTSQITIEIKQGLKDRLKWYQEDEETLKNSLIKRSELKQKIEVCETQLLKLKKEQQSIPEIFKTEFTGIKSEAFMLDLQIAPELLRRIVIATVPSIYAGYAMQFAHDLFELIQYPKIVRNIVFQVLDKTVQSLAYQLDESQGQVLSLPMEQTASQPFFNFLFSDTLKANFGSQLLNLVWSMSPERWSTVGLLTQTATRVVSGHFVFSKLQAKIEDIIVKTFKDRNAINWCVAKLVSTIDAQILHFANDPTDQGMTAVVTIELNKALGHKI